MKMYLSLNKIIAQGHPTHAFHGQSQDFFPALRRKIAIVAMCLIAMVLIMGCASTKVADREQDVTGQLPRPANIWVYDFAATAADLPAESALAGQPDLDTTPQSAEQIAEGRKLGDEIANQLVQQINAMGMNAAKAWTGVTPQINDIVIRGYLLSIKEGEAAKRVIVGFGSGGSELRTAVEGFQMTSQGLRKLGSGTVESGSGKTPGMAVGVISLLATHNPAGLIVSSGMKVYGEESGKSTVEGRAKQTAKEIADVLKKRFEQQGWIK
jgi:hypothetical protein